MTPRATYRLQFHQGFGFAAAARIAPYLARLGISHVYASSFLKARPGSTHGYDIVAHDQLNPELGTEADFRGMIEACKADGLELVLDVVPNHMGVGGSDNPLWLDVLEWGRESGYAGWFDIDWEPDRSYLQEKLLVPFLGEQYGVALDAGTLQLRFDAERGEFAVWAHEVHKLPICPLHYGRILGDGLAALENLGDAFASLLEWRPQVVRRANELKTELAALVAEDEEARRALQQAIQHLNDPQPSGRGQLDALIQLQSWRAAHFRVAGDDINYRRFFNINDLAGLRVELPDVFEHAHSLVFRLLREGVIDGLRIDHIDGLLDPRTYLERLRATALGKQGATRPFYLIVEKILARGERLNSEWPVEGTTGYEFANLVLGLLVDPSGEEVVTRGYREFTGERRSFGAIVRDCKIRIMKNEMASELNVLAREAARVARQNPRTADFTRNILHRALREMIAGFPVYRTYINGADELPDSDSIYLAEALKSARHRESDLDPSVFDFLESLLSGKLVERPGSRFSRHAVLRCAMKFQQYSGPVMAKGLEDTAFYQYNRFVALNEVGGHPDHFGIDIEEFHAANRERARCWPHSMLGTSTHDTKRGEDTRARLAVLSEIGTEWWAAVRSWSKLLRTAAADSAPDQNDEYLLYQLLIGTWPAGLSGSRTPQDALQAYRKRIEAALLKSMREAKVRSSWTRPDEAYEQSMMNLIGRVFDPDHSREFLESFLPLQERVARLGVSNSLVQTALKLTVPGVPDIYQGADLWDLSLVDPDNRRPVDYDVRVETLRKIGQGSRPANFWQQQLADWHSGAVKLALINDLLRFRAANPGIFMHGDYHALHTGGAKANQVLAFTRQHEQQTLLVAVVRFPARCEHDSDWRDTSVMAPPSSEGWFDLLTGRTFDAAEPLYARALFIDLPVAILVQGSA